MPVIQKRIAEFAFADNFRKDINLGNTDFLKKLLLFFDGNLVVGTTAGQTLVQDGLLKTVFKAITLVANGSDSFVRTTGLAEYFRRWMLSGSPGNLEQPAVTTGTNPCRVMVAVDFDTLRTALKRAGRIAATRLSSLSLILQTGDGSDGDLVTGASADYALSGTIEVVGEFSQADEGRSGGKRIGWSRYTNAGATADARMPLPSGLLIPRILLVAVDNALRVDTVVTKVSVDVGEILTMREMSFRALQAENVERYGLELTAGATPLTGLAMLDFDIDHDLNPSKLLNTVARRDETARLRLTVGAPTGTSYVDAYYYALDPRGVGRR